MNAEAFIRERFKRVLRQKVACLTKCGQYKEIYSLLRKAGQCSVGTFMNYMYSGATSIVDLKTIDLIEDQITCYSFILTTLMRGNSLVGVKIFVEQVEICQVP